MELHPTAVKEETGFSAVEMLLSLIIVILITFVGYYIYNTQKAAKATYASASQIAQAPAPKVAKKAAAAPAGYLVIKEWGVKQKVTDSDIMSYTYNGVASQDVASGLKYDSAVQLVIKTSALQDKSCANLGVGFERSTAALNLPVPAAHIGNYYFYSDGGPGACGTAADQKLELQVLQDLRTSKLEAL